LACHGTSTDWVSAGAVTCPPPTVSWSPCWPLAHLVVLANEWPSGLPAFPPEPPPRSACL
jgi:hypothetical protein